MLLRPHSHRELQGRLLLLARSPAGHIRWHNVRCGRRLASVSFRQHSPPRRHCRRLGSPQLFARCLPQPRESSAKQAAMAQSQQLLCRGRERLLWCGALLGLLLVLVVILLLLLLLPLPLRERLIPSGGLVDLRV
jgi:hypothetical protein